MEPGNIGPAVFDRVRRGYYGLPDDPADRERPGRRPRAERVEDPTVGNLYFGGRGMMMPELLQIGVVRSPFAEPRDVEKPRYARGSIEVFRPYEEGLKDIEGFSHVIVIWLFHMSDGCDLQCCPTRYSIPPPRGLFATRSPFRVNPIGLTVVRLLERRGPELLVKGVDMVDGTPVLDLKPYTRRDRRSRITCGWLDGTVIPPGTERPDRRE